MPTTMRAAVLDAPGPPEALQVREIPVPRPRAGQILIQVKAFGLNRSELHTRLGLADGVTFPRVLGIEATGIVAEAPGGEFTPGQQVVAMMGDMGRTYDGGYAEYTCVPASQVIAFESDLEWATLGAVPEMLQTANGSLTIGLDAQPGESILIRGGTSSIGMTTAVLAKQRGLTVLATTRNPNKTTALEAVGVDHVIIDDGQIAERVRIVFPDGVDNALELIGTPTLPDTLAATRVHGVVCFTGMLSNEWTVKDFYPIEYLPRGVRLTAYGGDATDLAPDGPPRIPRCRSGRSRHGPHSPALRTRRHRTSTCRHGSRNSVRQARRHPRHVKHRPTNPAGTVGLWDRMRLESLPRCAVPVLRPRPPLDLGGSAFSGFRFPPEVIILAVRWCLRYGLSYRDVEELLAEREGAENASAIVSGWHCCAELGRLDHSAARVTVIENSPSTTVSPWVAAYVDVCERGCDEVPQPAERGDAILDQRVAACRRGARDGHLRQLDLELIAAVGSFAHSGARDANLEAAVSAEVRQLLAGAGVVAPALRTWPCRLPSRVIVPSSATLMVPLQS